MHSRTNFVASLMCLLFVVFASGCSSYPRSKEYSTEQITLNSRVSEPYYYFFEGSYAITFSESDLVEFLLQNSGYAGYEQLLRQIEVLGPIQTNTDIKRFVLGNPIPLYSVKFVVADLLQSGAAAVSDVNLDENGRILTHLTVGYFTGCSDYREFRIGADHVILSVTDSIC